MNFHIAKQEIPFGTVYINNHNASNAHVFSFKGDNEVILHLKSRFAGAGAGFLPGENGSPFLFLHVSMMSHQRERRKLAEMEGKGFWSRGLHW